MEQRPDWTEQGRILMTSTAEVRVTEDLAPYLTRSGQDHVTVQRDVTLSEAKRIASEAISKLDSTVDKLASKTDAQISKLLRQIQDLTGYIRNKGEQIQEEITDALASSLGEHGFINVFEVDIERFRTILDPNGNKQVEWDGMVACEKGELRLLVLVKARSYLGQEQMQDTMAYRGVLLTKNFLDGIANAVGSEPPPDADNNFKQQWRFYQDAYTHRKLALAIGSPSAVADLAEGVLCSYCTILSTGNECYTVQGLEEAISHAY